jgi:hypothetical protein
VHYIGYIPCKCPNISHTKVERAFYEYINRINDLSETDIEIEDEGTKKAKELAEHIADFENKIANLTERKKRLMEQYVKEELGFDEYKEMLAILNETYAHLENELERIKPRISAVSETPKISREDLVLNIKENWDKLNNTERMIFLQRFVKRIVLNVEKERYNSNIVKIKSIEFNLSSELSLEELHRSEKQYKVSIRKAMKSVPTRKVGAAKRYVPTR